VLVVPAAVSCTAANKSHMKGIFISISVLLYLEGLALHSGRAQTALQCSKGTFRAFSFQGSN
jgi:hypothetical protein